MDGTSAPGQKSRRYGMGYEAVLKGQSFDFLRAEEKMPYKEDRYSVWRCSQFCRESGKQGVL